jgi:hypothetical protein
MTEPQVLRTPASGIEVVAIVKDAVWLPSDRPTTRVKLAAGALAPTLPVTPTTACGEVKFDRMPSKPAKPPGDVARARLCVR